MSFNEDYDDDLADLDLSVDSSDEDQDQDQYDDDLGIQVVSEVTQAEAKKPTRAEKRINELTWKAKTVEEQLAAERATNAELARRLAEINEAKNTEQVAALRAEKKEALEIGDYDRVTEIDDALMDARLNSQRQPAQQVQQPVAQQPAQPEIPPAQAAWMAKNQDILSDPDKVAKTDRIIKQLHDNGFRDEALWKQLDKNIHRVRPPSQAGNGVGSGDGNISTQGLTRADMEHIKELGYDYKDKAVQQNYLKSKRSAANGRA